MTTESEIREELAGEREELTKAVGVLREELGHTAERGKRIGAVVGAATGAAFFVRMVLRVRRGASS
jgi:hypothetical protein